MPIVVESRQLTALQRQLDAVAKDSRRSMGRALSSTQRATVTETGRALAENYTAGSRRIKSNTRASKVNTQDLSFTITGLRKPIQLQEYKHKASKRAGVSAQVRKTEGFKRIPTAFKASAGNFGGGGGSKARVFQRQRLAGGGQVGRMPIVVLFGPSVADMLNNEQVVSRIGGFALNKLTAEIVRQIEVAFRG